jgi:quercetin dioxygenase-like cupin family protein
MRDTLSALLVLVFMLWVASAVAQSPGAGTIKTIKMNPVAATSGTGVSNAALLDRPEVRVLRVDVEPGGVRNIHTHDDTQFHLFIPISGTPEFQIEPDKPAKLSAWEAQFVKGGTRHGFKNPGTTTATVVEVFVKK